MTQLLEEVLAQVQRLPRARQDDIARLIRGHLDDKKSGRAPRKHPRQPGSAKRWIEMADDFEEPLEDFRDYM